MPPAAHLEHPRHDSLFRLLQGGGQCTQLMDPEKHGSDKQRTSSTGALKAFSSCSRVAGARADEHERMARSGGGAAEG